jgi:hypothetical protein
LGLPRLLGMKVKPAALDNTPRPKVGRSERWGSLGA